SIRGRGGRSRSLPRFDSALRIDLDANQAVRVQNALDRPDRRLRPSRIEGLTEPRSLVAPEGLPEELEGVGHPLHLGRERLKLNVENHRQVLRAACRLSR